MAFTTKENSGALFKNNRKEKPSHPDFNGKIVLSPELAEIAANGGTLQLSAWKKESESGTQYLSIAISEPFDPNAKKKKKVVDEDEEEFEAPKKKKPIGTTRGKVQNDEEDDF